MVDTEEVELIKTDLELVTKTAKVLAVKLEKISKRIETIMSTLDGATAQSQPTTSAPAPQPAPTAKPPQKPTKTVRGAPKQDTKTVAYDGTNTKVTRFLESFLSQISSLSSGKDVAEALSSLRDQVMQSAEVGFHPAFHEMGRYANRLKNLKIVTDEEREALIEKITDWKARLS